jgi:hypothetical protein
MTKWTRVRGLRTLRCGGCDCEIPIGAPVKVFAIGAIVKVRCQSCDGPAPPDLPIDPVFDDDAPTRPLVQLRNLLPLDWRPTVSAMREREPGEDG